MEVVSHTRPFPHWIIDGGFPENGIDAAMDALPDADWPGWCRYSSAWESGKRTARDGLPGAITQLLGRLADRKFTMSLRELTGIADLIPAPFHHGGGLHVTDTGGRLDTHVDFAIHPEAAYLERRVSAILFLNTATVNGGGVLQLWNDDASAVLASISPIAGRVAIFENSDVSFHSVSEWRGVGPRVSLACYYCAPARPGVTRKRALWVPNRA